MVYLFAINNTYKTTITMATFGPFDGPNVAFAFTQTHKYHK